MTAADEARRWPVWVAVADLYLDTELREADYQQMASVCWASGFSWAEIQEINYEEVAPALLANLRSVAGEWAGWEDEWLLARIRSSLSPRPRRLLGSRTLWRKQVDFYTKQPLARVAAYLS